MEPMSILMTAAGVLAGASVVLLVWLTSVWARNHRTFWTALMFGLVVFGLVLLIENTVAIYFFSSMRSLHAHSLVARVTIASMRALQFLALAVLAVVTAK
jgi:riboflavin transporter FmnP